MTQFLIVTLSASTVSVPLMMTFSMTAPSVVMVIGPVYGLSVMPG